MNSSPLRQLILVTLSLAAVHCAPVDDAATSDLPEEAASALAQTYSFDASDCWRDHLLPRQHDHDRVLLPEQWRGE